MDNLRKFGLQYCDLKTMLWNVSVLLRPLVLNIDPRNKRPIPVIFYFLLATISLGYFYSYLLSTIWFVFCRCPVTGDLLAAIIVFSLAVSSEIGTVKLIFMFVHIGTVRQILTECLACDSCVVPGSRIDQNLLVTLREVKKRAVLFWAVIIGNGVVYIIKPIVLPGRHLMEDMFVLYVDYLIKKWRNVRDYYQKEKKMYKNALAGSKKKKKKYYYYDYLTFLDTVGKRKKRTASNSDSQDPGNETAEYLEDTSNDMISYEHCVVEEDSVNETPQYYKQEEESLTPKQMSFETDVLGIQKQDSDLNVTANRNFLLSLLPDMTSLNERQNMRFRIGVLSLLNDIKFEHT